MKALNLSFQSVQKSSKLNPCIKSYGDFEMQSQIAKIQRQIFFSEKHPSEGKICIIYGNYDDYGDYGDHGDYGDYGDYGNYSSNSLTPVEVKQTDVRQSRSSNRQSSITTKRSTSAEARILSGF